VPTMGDAGMGSAKPANVGIAGLPSPAARAARIAGLFAEHCPSPLHRAPVCMELFGQFVVPRRKFAFAIAAASRFEGGHEPEMASPAPEHGIADPIPTAFCGERYAGWFTYAGHEHDMKMDSCYI